MTTFLTTRQKRQAVFWAVLAVIFLGIYAIASKTQKPTDPTVQKKDDDTVVKLAEKQARLCTPAVMKELKSAPMIQRIDGDGYFIYVSRQWYGLTLDNKQAFALVAATCVGKDGAARFLDAHTGKILARWNGTEYKNHEN